MGTQVAIIPPGVGGSRYYIISRMLPPNGSFGGYARDGGSFTTSKLMSPNMQDEEYVGFGTAQDAIKFAERFGWEVINKSQF